MASLELYGEDKILSAMKKLQRLPFKNIFIHGLIRDEKDVKCPSPR